MTKKTEEPKRFDQSGNIEIHCARSNEVFIGFHGPVTHMTISALDALKIGNALVEKAKEAAQTDEVIFECVEYFKETLVKNKILNKAKRGHHETH